MCIYTKGLTYGKINGSDTSKSVFLILVYIAIYSYLYLNSTFGVVPENDAWDRECTECLGVVTFHAAMPNCQTEKF